MTRERRTDGARCVVGCSGYDYPEWQGVFYPEDLPRKQWFGVYAARFGGVEVNNTFYNLPRASVFESWRRDAPKDFVYVLKLSRYGTHMKKLKDPEEWLGHFFDRAGVLGDHLGPVLAQLPPKWGVDVGRLARFLEAAPEGCRLALEFRDPSWLCEDVYALMREHDAALVVHDMIQDHPRVETAGWLYLRYHGAEDPERYTGPYAHQRLSADARAIVESAKRGKPVYAFFNNDVGGHAPRDALRLRRYIERASERAERTAGA